MYGRSLTEEQERQLDEQILEAVMEEGIECPHCGNAIHLDECSLYEDQYGTEFTRCPVCEEAIPLEEIRQFLRDIKSEYLKGAPARAEFKSLKKSGGWKEYTPEMKKRMKMELKGTGMVRSAQRVIRQRMRGPWKETVMSAPGALKTRIQNLFKGKTQVKKPRTQAEIDAFLNSLRPIRAKA